MKRKCYKSTCHSFARYGGRGIKVCERWIASFNNFYVDMGERPEGRTLGRIDNDGHYEPINCRWETPSQQTQNRSTTKLKLEYVEEIRELRARGMKLNILSDLFNTSMTNISDVCDFNTWK